MSSEINMIIAAELADPDRFKARRLSEALYIRVSPELNWELMKYVAKRRVGVGTVVMEAMAALERRGEPGEPVVNGVRRNQHGRNQHLRNWDEPFPRFGDFARPDCGCAHRDARFRPVRRRLDEEAPESIRQFAGTGRS
jgi:hypothetical protein